MEGMSRTDAIKNLVSDWAERNVGPSDGRAGRDREEGQRLAALCEEQFRREPYWLTRAELDTAVGDLTVYMIGAIEWATAQRLRDD